MPDFEDHLPVSQPRSQGGSFLLPDPAAIFKACETVGPLFVLFRNEACILGSVANPIRLVESGRVRLVGSGAITLNLARRMPCSVVSYVESGPHGGLIDAIEFCGPRQAGFLKICRMERTDRDRWVRLLAGFHADEAPWTCIAAIRKTNHLDTPAAQGMGESPAGRVIEAFLECVLRNHATIHVTAEGSCARGRLEIRPTHRVRAGSWIVLSSNETALHLACGAMSELRVVARPHLIQLVLFGEGGRFLGRILTRDAAVIDEFRDIL